MSAVWQQVVAAVVAALVPVLVKIIGDWNRVALTRAGHPELAAGDSDNPRHVPTKEVPAVTDQPEHQDEPLPEPTPEAKAEADRLADEIRDATLHPDHDDEETQS